MVLIPVAFALLGAFLMAVSTEGTEDGMFRALAGDGTVATISGRAVSQPSSGPNLSSFFLEAGEAQVSGKSFRLRERVCVQVEGSLPVDRVFSGALLEARGRLALPEGEKQWLSDNGAGSVLRCSSARVTPQQKKAGLPARCVNGARRWLSDAYQRVFDPRVASFMQGVSLSKTDAMDPAVLADLRACGLSHLVAMAGLHVGSAAVLVLGIAAALGAGRRTRFALACLAALCVLGLSNFRLSATRAAIMAAACFAGTMLGRRYDAVVGVSIAGMAILCANPRALCDSSFQYSFAAALGIVLVVSRRRTSGARGKFRLALAVCAGAQLGILPLIVLKGEPAPVSALAANLMVVWLVGLLMMSGWAVALTSALCLPLARAASIFPAAGARYVMAVASVCARVPGAGLFMGALSAAALALYAASLVMFATGRETTSLLRPAVALGISVALVLFACFPILPPSAGKSMTVLDVGEGDATLLEDGGATVLIDGGPDPLIVMRKLRARGVSRIDLMVASHPHADHCAGLVEVMRNMTVGRLLDPGPFPAAGSAYRDLLRLASERKVPATVAKEGQVLGVSPDLSLEVLFAPSELSRPPANLNDCSIVAMARVAGSRVLLAGDIEQDAQQVLLKDHPSMICDVIKVPHQGAANAATDGLIDAARPAIATISVGRLNKFGHPSRKCLDLLASRNVMVLRTDLRGDIVISLGSGRIGLQSSGR